jgi:hypothetical protein
MSIFQAEEADFEPLPFSDQSFVNVALETLRHLARRAGNPVEFTYLN